MKLVNTNYSYILAIPLVNLKLASTNTTITLTWTPSSFVTETYLSYFQCRRLCEQTLGHTLNSNSSIASAYIFTGINPATYCIIGLNGIFNSNQYILGATIATTLSSGKVYYVFTFTTIILFSHNMQHPVHLSVTSLPHQLRLGL